MFFADAETEVVRRRRDRRAVQAMERNALRLEEDMVGDAMLGLIVRDESQPVAGMRRMRSMTRRSERRKRSVRVREERCATVRQPACRLWPFFQHVRLLHFRSC